jgi:hypothetical protein
MRLDANNLLSCASTLKGQKLETLTFKKPFAVKVTPDRIEIILGTGKLRRLNTKAIQRMCYEFAQSESMKPGDYKGITYNASYRLALIAGFRHGDQ